MAVFRCQQSRWQITNNKVGLAFFIFYNILCMPCGSEYHHSQNINLLYDHILVSENARCFHVHELIEHSYTVTCLGHVCLIGNANKKNVYTLFSPREAT